jgi:hypothetical protein
MYGYNNTVPNPLLVTSSSSTVSSTTTLLSYQSTTVVSTSQTSSASPTSSRSSSSQSSSTSTASPASTSPSWSYVGCWTDAVGSRTLGMSECVNAGYTLAGLEYYSECYCDTQVKNGAALATDPTTCNTACQVSLFSFEFAVYFRQSF